MTDQERSTQTWQRARHRMIRDLHREGIRNEQVLLAMRTRLAQLLTLPEENIGVKARSNEGMDAVGAGEALAAHVVVVLLRASPAAP